MNDAAVKPLREATLRHFRKSARNVEWHRGQMSDPEITPEYRQAVKEALEQWEREQSQKS